VLLEEAFTQPPRPLELASSILLLLGLHTPAAAGENHLLDMLIRWLARSLWPPIQDNARRIPSQ
jgi:hypothetical protein